MRKEKQSNITALLLDAKTRSDDKVALVLAERERLNNLFNAGKLTADEIAELKLGSFCRQAGVGENFLNGDLHKESLKPKIKQFIRQLKKRWEERNDASQGNTAVADSELELETSNTRLKDMLHAARLQLHAQRKIIRSLSEGNSPKVVPLKPAPPLSES